MTVNHADRRDQTGKAADADGDSRDGMPALSALIHWAKEQTRFDGRYGLSLRSDRAGSLFAPLVAHRETFFRDGQGVATVSVEDNPHLPDFLERRNTLPVSYGYPVHVDPAGLVTPLLFVEVSVQLTLESVRLSKTSNQRPRLSRRVLVEAGHDPVMADAACRAIEHGAFPSFEVCLTALAGHLDLPPGTLADMDLEGLPEGAAAPGWFRTPILFRSPVSPLQKAHLGELELLPQAYTAATHTTALHSLVARREPQANGSGGRKTERPPVAEIEPLSAGTPEDLETCLAAALSVVEAPPGGEKEGFIANAIANLVISGQSVLYVHPAAEMTDEVVERFQGLLARRQCWIPRLGGEQMLERLSRSADDLEAQRPTGIAPPSKQARQRALAEPKGELATARGRIDSARSAVRALAAGRAERRRLRMAVAPAWQAVLDHADRLEIGAETAAASAEELESMAEDRPGLFGRLFGRKDMPARVQAMAGAAADAVAKLPDAIWAGLPLPDRSTAVDPASAAVVADAFRQLERIVRWRELAGDDKGRLADVLKLPPAHRIAEQLAQAESRLARESQGLLRDVWRAAVAKGAAKSAEKLAAVFQAITDRQFSGDAEDGGPEPAGDQQLARFMRLLVRNYPLWAIPADLVPSQLPLTDGLFDMAIVDDAGSLTAGAMLPLLLRVRHAMVLAPVDRDSQPVNSGFALAAASQAARAAVLPARMRQHPEIVRYLSAAFHDGGLSLAAAGPSRFGKEPGLAGLQWHQSRRADVEEEAGVILALLEDWHARGLFGGEAALTVGIAVPTADRLRALEQAVLAVVPGEVGDEALLFGPPAQFKDLVLDVMLLVPGLSAGMAEPAAEALAWNRELFHDAAAAGECGLHIVGDAATCTAAGGFAASLVRHCRSPAAAPGHEGRRDSEARHAPEDEGDVSGLARLCEQAELPWRPVPGGVEVVGRFGSLTQFLRDTSEASETAASEADSGLNAETFIFYLKSGEFSQPSQWVGQLLERLC